jgi:putative ABC transport system permease protein
MKYLPLIWAGLWRKPVRTVFTFLSIASAFVLFGLLQGVSTFFDRVIDQSSLDRLMVQNRIRLVEPLPLAHLQRIVKVPGVARVTHTTWFGGNFQDVRNFVAAFAVDFDSFAAVYPEVKLSAAMRAQLDSIPASAVIGPALARKFGWHVGDEVPLRSNLWTQRFGKPWSFRIVGIYKCAGCVSDGMFLMSYNYFNEARSASQNTVGQFVLRVSDPRFSPRVALAVDELFANSPAETRTQSERETAQSQLKRIGDVSFFVRAILGAVFFTLLLLTTNTTMQSFRERTAEFAVLKTYGYRDGLVAALVISESLSLCLAAAAAGLLAAEGVALLASLFANAYLGGVLPPTVLLAGVACAVVLAIIGSLIPGWRASRLSIVDALAVM